MSNKLQVEVAAEKPYSTPISMKRSTANCILATAIILVMTVCRVPVRAQPVSKTIRSAVVKIYTTLQRENYALPWQGRRPSRATGSGYIIEKRRILTNAHIVSDSRFLQVQKAGDPRRYRATVTFIGHDCDLALLSVEDEAFYKDTSSIRFAEQLPKLNDEVMAIGYPLGGDRLSVTKGIVSRIDYSVYSHSAVDSHLVLQVDAAINPGNSGGPVLYKDLVIGVAFQGISWAENIGYVIPIPVIQHFLDDVKDGTYQGYPELGAAFLNTRNAALRKTLALHDDKTGVVIYYLDPFGSAIDNIYPRDVLLSIDGHDIANDGTIKLQGNPVLFTEMLERKQSGEAVLFKIWRKEKEITVEVPLKSTKDPFAYRNLYDRRPRYYLSGGIVFSALSREYLRTQRAQSGRNIQQLLYYLQYAKIDGLYKGNDEFVVLARRLPHAVNTYAADFINSIVTKVNGNAISCLEDIKKAMTKPKNGYHIIEFADKDDTLVLDAKEVQEADRTIFEEYGVPSPEHFGDKP